MRFLGDVCIGNAAPTEKLDIAGNLRLNGAFMPNNQPGAAGQFLTTGGPGVAPTWGILGQSVTTVNSTAQLVNPAAFTSVPGMSVTISASANTLVLASAQLSVINTTGVANSTCQADVAFAIDNVLQANGYQRMLASNTFTTTGLRDWYSASVLLPVPAGVHTITLAAVRIGGNSTTFANPPGLVTTSSLTVAVVTR